MDLDTLAVDLTGVPMPTWGASLPPGTHTFPFRDELANGPVLDVTYTLIVTRGR